MNSSGVMSPFLIKSFASAFRLRASARDEKFLQRDWVFYLVLPLLLLRGFLDGLTLGPSTLSFPSFGIDQDSRCFLCHEFTY
jgi:hypothetical protein